MKIMLVIGSIALPIFMFFTQKRWGRLRDIYHIIAMIAVLVFGNIASLSIYTIIKEGTVFMTAIHGIFLNPFFLMAGSYIGVYVLYGLLLLSAENQRG